jgi:hypothetical protein
MDKKNIIASLVESETSCLFEDLLEDKTFKKLFYKYLKTKDTEMASELLADYANENLC